MVAQRPHKGTDWTVNEGLFPSGLPDPRWIGKSVIQMHPQIGIDCIEWLVQIQWGSTWGHYVAKTSQDPQEALTMALGSALEHGCPPEWLPMDDNGWKTAVA